jgi:hypothetical protein
MFGVASRHPHAQEVLLSSFAAAVNRINGEVAQSIPALYQSTTETLGIS